jgi:class 3 adenylate cyclase
MIRGMEDAVASGADGLDDVQDCLEAITDCITEVGGLLRQFMLDDKGVVCIWNFGLSSNVFEDSAARALQSCSNVRQALAMRSYDGRIGVTLGTVFCGLVGATDRCEYAVMGASVNLSARLMGKAEDVLCNEEVVRDFKANRIGLSSFTFDELPPMRVKGFANEVNVFRPQADEKRQEVPHAHCATRSL